MPSFLADDFRHYLSNHSVTELEASAHTVVGLRPDNSIGYRNGAWTRFASSNGAPQLAEWNGTPITDVFADEIKDFYLRLFEEVRETQEPRDHDYECSSPVDFRIFRLRVLPLRERGLLLLHHLTVEHPHTRPAHPPADERYRSNAGIIAMCAHCRRVRRVSEPKTWDWVPAYLEPNQLGISHGLCELCFRHYYPELIAARDRKLRGER